MNGIKIDLSEYQIKNIKDAYENHKPVRIRLSYEQIEGKGKYEILLSEPQKEKLDKSKELKNGVILELIILF
jgi:hypothetical protein